MTTLLQLNHVTKKYKQHVAIDDLTLTLPSGKIVGLLGPNGSGKTTLIKLISGLLQVSAGSIAIDGFCPSVDSKKIISYLPDTSYLREDMRVREIIAMFADFYEDFSSSKAQQLLDDLAIDPNSYLKHLSKGNKEKVQLILVMSRKAKLYLLDEPIGGVDPAARDYILQTIISQYNPEATVIISTHLISDIEPVLDHIIFLKEGKLLLQGDTDTIRDDYGQSIDSLFRTTYKN